MSDSSRKPDPRRSRFTVGVAVVSLALVMINFLFGLVADVFKVPGLSGLATGFTVPFFLTLSSIIFRKFWTATAIWTLYSIIAVPLSLMGPPGFYKIAIGFFGGFAYDVTAWAISRGKMRKFAYYAATIAYTLALMAGFIGVYLAIPDMPFRETFFKTMYFITAVFIAEGMASVWMALRTYASSFEGTQIDEFFRC